MIAHKTLAATCMKVEITLDTTVVMRNSISVKYLAETILVNDPLQLKMNRIFHFQ